MKLFKILLIATLLAVSTPIQTNAATSDGIACVVDGALAIWGFCIPVTNETRVFIRLSACLFVFHGVVNLARFMLN
jgi:hypothetical protein